MLKVFFFVLTCSTIHVNEIESQKAYVCIKEF